MRNYNTTIGTQYHIYARKADKPAYERHLDEEYSITFRPTNPTSEGGNIEADFCLGKEDLVNIARAVLICTNARYPIDKSVRKHYLAGCRYDEDLKVYRSFGAKHRESLYQLTVEKKHNHVLDRWCYDDLFKLTFTYNTVFGNEDKFVIVLREHDFINLGRLAWKMLEKDVDEFSIG